MKKKHWTQTRAGKAKLAAAHAKAAQTRAARSTPTTEKPHASDIPHDTLAYALGHVECWLDTFAKSAGVSAETLTARVGAVLHLKIGR
jgi:hypothetical protein